jgi:hypothetical protein
MSPQAAFLDPSHSLYHPRLRRGDAPMPTNVPVGRDLRLDLFRGIALWLIFLDHIPFNVVNWVTIRNYGFSDAAEIFVFISGYTAAFVYARAMREKGPIGASARILKRAWQVYVAHVFLFVIYLAEISYVGAKFDNPLFAEEFNLFGFLRSPDVILTQALILKFKPVNMDVLPLYIVLLLAFPPLLWSLLRSPNLALLGSGILYVLARKFGWNLPAFPAGKWYFNPFAWQFLFVFGAWCGLGGVQRLGALFKSRAVLVFCIAYVAFAMVMTLAGHFPRMHQMIPTWIDRLVNPLDKTNLDPLRFLHFAILAFLTVRYIPRDWPYLKWSGFRPAIICGEHSLEIFCLGIFLSFAGHFMLVEISNRAWMQILVSLVGILIMIGVAWVMNWYKKLDARGPKSLPPQPAPEPQPAPGRPLAGDTA